MTIPSGCARRLRLGAATLLAALLPTAALAQSAETAHTLRQAFDAAWQRQPEARGADSRRQAAQAQQSAASRWTAEPLALELSNKTDRLTGNRGAREYEIGLSAPLWLPGERGHTQAVAQAEAAALEGRLEAARWRLAGVVREAWWQAQRATLDVQAAQAGLANAQRLAADVARRVSAGDLARADQHQSDGAAAAAAAALAEARAAQTVAHLAVRSLAGLAPAPAPSAAPEPEPAPQAAPAAHAALREIEARAELARRARALAAAQGRANPELSVSTTRDRGVSGDPYDQSITVAVRFPFGGGDAQRGRLAAADAERIEAESALALEQARLIAELAGAQARVQAAKALLEAAQTRARLAGETRGYFDKSFRLGESDLPTRLRVEQEAFEAERQRDRAHIDLAQAISAWRQALGLLPD